MLNEILKSKNLSVYKLSELSNVPYTTVNELVNGKKNIADCKIKTIENIAKALNVSIETLLNMSNNKISLSNSWEENKNKKYSFPVIIENNNYECTRIHPLKQKVTDEIYQYVKNNKYIQKVIIFGSSVNIRCHRKSDVDIAIMIHQEEYNISIQNSISEEIQEITNYNADIIWLNKVEKDTKLYNNIYNKGVVIYE